MRRGATHNVKSSDQMPEEAPAEQVPDDVPDAREGGARESARRHAHRQADGHQDPDAGQNRDKRTTNGERHAGLAERERRDSP